MVQAIFWVGLGAFGAVALLALLRLVAPARMDIAVFGTTCAIFAVYVGFAIGEPLAIVIAEAAVATLAPLIILAFWSRRVILLPIALIGHAGLDLFHHSLSMGFPPLWYVQACLSLDVVFALGAYALMRRNLNHQGP